MTIRILTVAAVVGLMAASASTQTQKVLGTCIGSDRVIRIRTGPCGPGAQPLDIPLDHEDDTREHERLDREIAQLSRKVDLMSARMAALESLLADALSTKPGGKVMAPFEIVNEDGATMVKVFSNDAGGTRLDLYNEGKPNLFLSSLAGGGFVKTQSSGTFPEVVVGSNGGFGGLVIRDADQQARLTAGVADGKPSVELTNDNHTVVANLNQGSTGGGHLELGDAAGNAMVRAGITAGGCGRVETLPAQAVVALALGIPGDKILGNCK